MQVEDRGVTLSPIADLSLPWTNKPREGDSSVGNTGRGEGRIWRFACALLA
jgi:hypothetical protein